MKCPRCENSVLDERERDGVTVDVCRECRGVWLDRSELERILARALREQQEAPGAPQAAPPQAAPPQAPPGYAPPPGYAQPPGYGPPPGYAQPPAPGGYYHRDDDTPPHGYRRDGHHPHRRKHWFESLTDIFD